MARKTTLGLIQTIENKHGPMRESKAQKQFNSYCKKIDKLKAQLREWQHDVPQHQQRIGTEYRTLSQAFIEARIEFVRLLDRAYQHTLFNKRDKKKIKHMILQVAAEMLRQTPSDEMKAFHDRYSEFSYDDITDDTENLLKRMMEDALGIEIGDDVDLSTPEKVNAFREALEREENERIDQRSRSRAKSAKQTAKEERLEAEQRDIHKSLQDIYRKLAAALHPDREFDSAQRANKTELMQRANIAYDKGDLLQLFEIQLEIDQVDRTHFQSLSEQRLQQYNRILKEQCVQLQNAIDDEKRQFIPTFQSPGNAMSPKTLMATMDGELEELRRNVKAIRNDLKAFQNFTYLKDWLRNITLQQEPQADMEFMLEMFESIAESGYSLPSQARKKRRKSRSA